MRRGEETGLASCNAGSNRVFFTASNAERSRDSWPDEVRTTADTTLPVSSMKARIVTTPCHPALFALRGYTGSISPRGLGAMVVDPATPGCASPGAPTPPPGPPMRAAAPAPEPADAGAAAGPGAAPASAAAGLCEPGSVSSLAAASGSFAGSAPDGAAAGTEAVGGDNGEAARIPGGEMGPAASLPAPTVCAASALGPGRESRLTSMAGGPGSLCPAIRGTKSMTACRLRATRTERPNTCRGFTRAPPTSLSYSFRLTPVTRENGGIG
jgi:hypothetical protein